MHLRIDVGQKIMTGSSKRAGGQERIVHGYSESLGAIVSRLRSGRDSGPMCKRPLQDQRGESLMVALVSYSFCVHLMSNLLPRRPALQELESS